MRIFDGFLTGLTGLFFVGQSEPVYLVERTVFDRFDRFDRFFSHTHMKKTKIPASIGKCAKPVKPVKTCQDGAAS